jgi:phage shock protein A
MDQLRESSLRALEWPVKRKKLVHQVVQMDAQNNKMRTKIKTLREDIDVLRDQIGVLERRVNFVNSQDTKY